MKKKILVLVMSLLMTAGVGSQVYANTNDENINIGELSLYEKLYITQDELNEKYGNNYKTIQNLDVNNGEDKASVAYEEVSAAYKRVQDEENYIVDLINGIDKTSNTTLSDWEYNLKWLKDNYDSLKEYENEKINFKYIDSYIEAYEFVLLDKYAPDEKSIDENYNFELNSAPPMLRATSSYSADEAVKYAKTYYRNYNRNYPDWSDYGGDCANFVSQCLYEGGQSKRYGNGDATDFSNWFSDGNTTNTRKVSSTWRGADAFKHYWKSNATEYKKFTSFSGAYNYGYKGDAVSLLNDRGRAYHTLIIVGYDDGDLVFGAHTDDKIDGSLKSVARYSDFIIYRMK